MSDIRHEAANISVPSIIPSGKQEVMALYGSLIEPERLLYPGSAELAVVGEVALLEGLTRTKDAGKSIGIVDGAFDVPHDNHTWYLREARRRAARKHFGKAFVKASPEEQQQMVASDEIVLIVTLDADAKIAQMKGFQSEKGNVARPVYSWDARANRIGGFMIPNGSGAHRPVLDLITVEGDSAHKGSMFESHLLFGRSLAEHELLDTWVLFDEHQAVIDAARSYAGAAASDIISVVPQHEARFAIDPRSREHWSSSAIIRRIVESSIA